MARLSSFLQLAGARFVLGALVLGGAGLAAASGGALAGCNVAMGPAAKSAGDDSALVGAPAPDFKLEAQSGAPTVSLADGAGKVMIVDFWATWCAPCRESFPVYQKLVEKYGDKLVLVGISVDEDSSGIAGFASETGAKFPLAWDKGQEVAGKYQPLTMPTSFVIDKRGVVRFVHAGYRAGDERTFAAEIEALAAE